MLPKAILPPGLKSQFGARKKVGFCTILMML